MASRDEHLGRLFTAELQLGPRLPCVWRRRLWNASLSIYQWWGSTADMWLHILK